MTDASPRQRLFLIDGNSLAYRAYFALPETIATSDGFPTNALYGFSAMLLKIIAEYEPAAIVVAWDAGEKTFRHADFEDYKAGRPSMPDLLQEQWPYFEELVASFGLPNLKKEGYEADDILATLATVARRESVPSVVVTGDRDALQLVDEGVAVMTTGRGISEVTVYTPQKVVERYGVTPAQVPDFIGLKGDTSDNIPGVPGVGEKTAAQLIQQFGSIDQLYDRLDEAGSEKRRTLLAENEVVARLSRQLAQMVTDVPLDADVTALVRQSGYEVPVAQVDEFFRRFQFNSLAKRVRELAGARAADEAAGSDLEDVPRLVVGQGAGELAALLERDRGALAFVLAERPSGRAELASAAETAGGVAGGEGAGRAWVAAIYGGGDAVVAAPVVGEETWCGLWLHARQVLAHDAKSFPGFAAASDDPAFDTALAGYLIAPERPESDLHKLARVAAEQVMEGPQVEAQAATRAVLTWRLAGEQERRLRELELESLFREIELPLARVLAQMEGVGIKMDPYRLGEITARVRERVEEVQDRVHELAGGEFNIGSTQQLAEVLFSRLQLAPVRRGKTGYSTDARVLKALRDLHPVVPAVEEWRELTKLLNTYLEPLPRYLDRASRLHTTFSQTTATTGRLSSSNPNLQNIPIRTELGSQIRTCFVAEDGWRLIVADYSQIELRLMAYLAQEPALIEAYHRGEDVHRSTAAAVAGIAPEEVTKTQRERAKATNFGIMYGLSAYGLSEQVDIPREEAQAFIDAYFAKYPHVRAFREETIRRAAEDGYVRTVFGRRRAVPELRAANFRERSLGERLAVNTVLQGSAADIIKVAMIRAARELAARGMATRLVLQIHDELIFEAPEGEVEAALPLVDEAMCRAYEMDPALDISVGVGENWYAAK